MAIIVLVMEIQMQDLLEQEVQEGLEVLVEVQQDFILMRMKKVGFNSQRQVLVMVELLTMQLQIQNLSIV